MCNNANFGILKLIHPSIRGEVAASGGSGPQEACHVELDGHQNCSEPTPDRVRRAAPDVRDLASWSGPDEVNVTDNITAMSSRCLK